MAIDTSNFSQALENLHQVLKEAKEEGLSNFDPSDNPGFILKSKIVDYENRRSRLTTDQQEILRSVRKAYDDYYVAFNAMTN